MRAGHASFFETKMRLPPNPLRALSEQARDAGAEQFVMAIKQALSMR
jgi:hypothetical protein